MKMQDLQYICKLIYESFHIPVIYINENDVVELEFTSLNIESPFHTSKQEMLKPFQFYKDHFPFPLFVTTDYYENYFMIQVMDHNQYKGTIIVGPTLPYDLTNERVNALIHDMPIRKDLSEKLVHYYELLPRLSNMKFINISMQLYYMLFQKTLDPADIILKNIELGEDLLKIEDPHVAISQKRENVSFHHDFMYEKRLFQYIKEGRKDEFLKIYKLSPEKGELGVLSKKSQLRNSKNLGITAITLATRAAMEGGLHHEIAYTLSDLYIQNLEELTDMKTVDAFMEQALSDFADRVRKHKQHRYSKPINRCLNFIYTHLYEDLTLTSLANLVDLHPNYLSSLFKKEVGISIAEYIQRTKVDEAKSLLTFTNYSLLKITTILNFHDQSYFTKVFRKYTGVTPKKYKNTLEKGQ
ncbi:helix-turn-helix domain-containing protein [Metabacillus sediminilitoris]|uniref:Helix-turn-helix domain-containing protein n=1 Tax=Metabacillus sediminilitoris TaxID=2567941 RepID=A0A4S4BTW0_9BACI|nr:helix-turn-helix domain-containing protein [Metabacillus sediminilitoris]QGQ44899.1 helix-turn-helix domain-containing protein [Metabacillus sediminilitoris]THF78532.1 helix-turn-helix domain-containing protein [Metabacillus sediminilitoris]